MKFTYHFSQHNIRQKLLVFSLKFKNIITVVLDLIVFSIFISVYLYLHLYITATG